MPLPPGDKADAARGAAPHGDGARYVLLAVTMASFVAPFMSSSMNVAIPVIGREFGLGAAGGNWIVTAYVLATATLLLPSGRASDIYGRKRVFATGMLAYAATSLVCGLAPSGTFLIVARLAQGAASALIFSTSVAMLSSAYPPHRRGRVLGFTVAAVYMGLSAGPALGGLITQHFGWRFLFHLNVVAGAFTYAIAELRIPAEWRDPEHTRFDAAGACLYVTGLTSLLYGVTAIHSLAGQTSAAAGLILLAAFGWWETRAHQPLLDLRLFQNTVFAFSNLAALIHYSATFAVSLLLSYFLQAARHLDAQQTGLVLLSQPIMMALVSPAAGMLSDRMNPRHIASAGMGLTCAGLAGLAFLKSDTPLYAIIALQLLMGIGFGLFSSPNTNAIMGAVEPSRFGVASATLGTVRMVGQAFSMALLALFFSWYVGNTPILDIPVGSLMAALRISFAVFAALCFAGIFASMRHSVPRSGF